MRACLYYYTMTLWPYLEWNQKEGAHTYSNTLCYVPSLKKAVVVHILVELTSVKMSAHKNDTNLKMGRQKLGHKDAKRCNLQSNLT